MAFQSRVVLQYVQVTKKMNKWQEKKKAWRISVAAHMTSQTSDGSTQQRQENRGTQSLVSSGFPKQAFQNKKKHRNLFSFFPCAGKFATFSRIFLLFSSALLFCAQNGQSWVISFHCRISPTFMPYLLGGKSSKCMTYWVFNCLSPVLAPSKTRLS